MSAPLPHPCRESLMRVCLGAPLLLWLVLSPCFPAIAQPAPEPVVGREGEEPAQSFLEELSLAAKLAGLLTLGTIALYFLFVLGERIL